MSLSAGTRLGAFEIIASIGAGGMGEVYKARDTRLDRVVAIKALPEHLAENPERKQRFEREAKAISQLNHPHICTLYDIGRDRSKLVVLLEAPVATGRHDYVVQKLDPEDLARLSQPFGQHPIFLGWRRVAGRVVVKRDDRRGLADGRFAVDLSRMDERAVQDSSRHDLEAFQPIASVEHEDAELFERLRSETGEQKLRRVSGKAKPRTLGLDGTRGALAELESGENASDTRVFEAAELRERGRARLVQPF